MLSHAKLLKSYWTEAMLTVVYLINRSPSVPLKVDVPQRVWTGRNVSYQHLRVFRCLAYMHVAKDEFSYRLWDFLDKKVVRSRDIVFMEDRMIEEWRQKKPLSSSQTATIMELALVDPSPIQPVGRE